jgi:hypothetical protein
MVVWVIIKCVIWISFWLIDLILGAEVWPLIYVNTASNRSEYLGVKGGRPEHKDDNLTAISEPTV